MKGNQEVIDCLNFLLADELTATSQYMVHAGMCANWGYEKLHKSVEKRAIDEMKHAEILIDRVLFLQGTPIVSNLNKMTIGASVDEQLKSDQAAEVGAIHAYNDGIRLASEKGDYGTADFLKSILKDEEVHMDWLEAQLDQIDQMGLPNYLLEKLA
jgi:bacterioferritin